jgi:hypothetical protein
MSPPKEVAPWEMKPEDVGKQLAGQQFEDCLSCRVTGMSMTPCQLPNI